MRLFSRLPIKALVIFSCLLALLFTPIGLAAQPSDPMFVIEDLFSYTEIVYSALIIVGGYLSAKIPLFNKISNGAWRIFAFAIVTGIGFIAFGAPVLSLAVTYFFSTSLYEIVLKPTLGGSPKVIEIQ